MCSARTPDAPPHRPWLSWETAVQSSPSDGGSSSIPNGVPFTGNSAHMLPAWHIAPLVHWFDAPSSGGRAWPESPRRSGTTLSGAGMLPASCFLHLSFVKYQHDAFHNVGGQPTLVSLQRRLHFTLHPPHSGLSNFPAAHEGGAFCDQLPCPLADSVLTGSHPSWSSLFHFYLFLVHFYGVVDSIKFGC